MKLNEVMNNPVRQPAQVPFEHIDWSTAELDGIDTRDYPDFVDAFVAAVDKKDGTPCTDEELDFINDNYGDTVYELVMDHLH